MRHDIGLFGFCFLGTLAGAIACTTTTTTTETPTGGDGGASTTQDGSTSTKDSGGTSDDGSSEDPDLACGAETTQQACAQCCATNHPSGYETFAGTLLACACKGTGADGGAGVCATECADTACAQTPKTPTSACNTCLQTAVGSGGGCQQAVSDACTAEPDCLAQQKCVAQCQNKK
jgi:hypothetical protein